MIYITSIIFQPTSYELYYTLLSELYIALYLKEIQMLSFKLLFANEVALA